MTDPSIGEINDYAASDLKLFDFNGILIGGLICNDMWANPGCTPMPDPHLTHQLKTLGAKIIFHAVNGGRNGSSWSTGPVWQYHESNLQMRASSDRIWIVTVDNASPTSLPCSAPSGIIKPNGEWACKAPDQGNHLFVHMIQLE